MCYINSFQDMITKDNMSIIIAGISLLISLLTMYFTLFKPFDPKIYFAGINLIPPSQAKDAVNSQFSIGLAIELYNNGANLGSIEDMAVELRNNKTGFRGVFYPFMFYDNQKLLENKMVGASDLTSMKSIFTTIVMPVKEKISKELFFILDKSNGVKFEEGEYEFIFYIKFLGCPYKEIYARKEKISKKQIEEMMSGTIIHFLPFGERDNFATRLIHSIKGGVGRIGK